MRPMRRKERQVTDPARIREILADCKICHLGIQDGKKVYVVPLNFGLLEEDGKYLFYFHCANEGRKLDLIRENPSVGFELDRGFELVTGQHAIHCTSKYQSVIGEGTIAEVEDDEEKVRGLNALMGQYTDKSDWTYPPAMLAEVTVLRLTVEELSCKENM